MNKLVRSPLVEYEAGNFAQDVKLVSQSVKVGLSVCSEPSEEAKRGAFEVFRMIQKDFLDGLPVEEFDEPGQSSLVARAATPFRRLWEFEEVDILNVHEGWPSDDNSDFVIRLKARPSLLVFFDGSEGLWVTIASTPFHLGDKADLLLYVYSPHETVRVNGCGPWDFAVS